MSPAQRGFLVRTLCLVSVICGATFVVARLCFESEADLKVEVLTSIFSIVSGLIGGWFFVVRPMGTMIRDQVEKRERDFHERFNEIIDSMQECVIVYDRKGVVSWNRSALKTMQVTADEMRGNQVIHPSLKLTNENGSALSQNDRPTEQCFKSGIPISAIVGLQRADGRSNWLRVHTSPIFAKRTEQDRRDGAPPRVDSVIATFRDITSEREATQRFDLAMKAVKLGVWDFDFVTGAISWDQAMYELFEVDPSTVQSKRGYEFFESFVVPEDRERVKRTIELSVLECRDNSMEFRVMTGEGNIRAIRSESKGFYSRDGKPLRHVGVNWDITVQREQELRVLQASKMSTLGEMSAGIAHEINNPLAIILGKTEAMRTALEAPAFNRELMGRHIETMERTANRIAKIVRGLRTFSRDGDQDPFEVTNVSEIVNEAVALCNSRFLNHGIELHVTNAPDDMTIDARAVQISQVLLNLLNNAFDAVAELDEKWVRMEVRSLGRQIEFSVTDSGSGIPEEVRTKMLQPFFTTKDVGMGTGLGLSIATGIVVAHGGTLDVDPLSPNTRFIVRLPRSHSSSAHSAA